MSRTRRTVEDVKEKPEIGKTKYFNIMNNYSIILGNTYYNSGYFNLGIDASTHLDNHGASLKITIRNQGEINTTINREINANGSIRIYGGNEWKNFIQNNFHLNQEIQFEVISANTIRII